MTSMVLLTMALALLAQLLGLAEAWRQLHKVQRQVGLHTGNTERHTERSEGRPVVAVVDGVGGGQ